MKAHPQSYETARAEVEGCASKRRLPGRGQRKVVESEDEDEDEDEDS